MSVPTVELSNGNKLPLLGYGTWLSSDPEQLKTALRTAFDTGYRYVDTAKAYGNEHVIGEVIKEYIDNGKFKRSDLFITTKLPFFAYKPDIAEEIIAKQLKDLQFDYFDLYLIHHPTPFGTTPTRDGTAKQEDGKFVLDDTPVIEPWRVLEKHYKAGHFKAIGISNFNSKQIQELYDQAEIKPQNLQVELHILFPQFELVDFCKKLNITVTSYSTLGNPGRGAGLSKVFVEGDCLNHPVTLELAKKYNKTPAQILLRHVIQRGISVIPKSVTPERIRQNFDVLDFEIAPEDAKKINEIGERKRLLVFDFAFHHPRYPFHEAF